MTQDDIKKRVIEIIGDNADDGCVVTEELKLDDDLGLDSLDIIEMSMELEEAFNIELFDDDLPEEATVTDVIALVEKKVSVN